MPLAGGRRDRWRKNPKDPFFEELRKQLWRPLAAIFF
jgi:hypothetical protein